MIDVNGMLRNDVDSRSMAGYNSYQRVQKRAWRFEMISKDEVAK